MGLGGKSGSLGSASKLSASLNLWAFFFVNTMELTSHPHSYSPGYQEGKESEKKTTEKKKQVRNVVSEHEDLRKKR